MEPSPDIRQAEAQNINKPSGKQKYLMIGCIAILLLCGISSACVYFTKPDPEEYAQEKAKEKEDFKKSYDSLYNVYTTLNKENLEQKSCDGATIKANYKGIPSNPELFVVDYEYLKKFNTAEGTVFEYPEEWLWLNNDKYTEKLELYSAIEDLDHTDIKYTLEDIEESRYLAVLYSTEENSNPVILEDNEEADFLQGIYNGWLMIVDQQTAEIACAVAVEATNSETVNYRTSGATRESLESAIANDFEKNLREAMQRRVDLISGTIKIKY